VGGSTKSCDRLAQRASTASTGPGAGCPPSGSAQIMYRHEWLGSGVVNTDAKSFPNMRAGASHYCFVMREFAIDGTELPPPTDSAGLLTASFAWQGPGYPAHIPDAFNVSVGITYNPMTGRYRVIAGRPGLIRLANGQVVRH